MYIIVVTNPHRGKFSVVLCVYVLGFFVVSIFFFFYFLKNINMSLGCLRFWWLKPKIKLPAGT